MPDSIWKSTLEEFRAQLAGRDPVPAGVSTAAITASLALSLLIKVLEIARNSRDFRGDPGKIEEMLASARAESSKLARYADEDAAAFAAYMASRGTPNEPAALLLRKAIEIPLEAARAAAMGLKLCAGAIPMTPASIQPDLGAAAFLLTASVRAMLLSAESNAQRLADPDFQREVAGEVENLKLLAQNHQPW
jgi:formiminotetrahydrofolate cyclodeaminase